MVSGPGAWVVGIISIRLMFTRAGSPTTQALARYSVFVKTVSPVSATSRSATQERVVVSWPPQAVNAAGSLESVIALDRN